MEDLINTVRQRYGRSISYRCLSTLTHRERIAQNRNETEQTNKKGILGFLRSQTSNVSQKFRDEVNRLMELRDKTVLQAISREIPRLVQQHSQQWRADSAQAEKTQSEAAKRIDKRVELFTVDTCAKLKAIQRELELLKLSEKIRRRDEAKTALNEPSLSRRAAKLIISEYAKREREEIRRDIYADLARTERRITRRLRDEEEYEKRRRC